MASSSRGRKRGEEASSAPSSPSSSTRSTSAASSPSPSPSPWSPGLTTPPLTPPTTAPDPSPPPRFSRSTPSPPAPAHPAHQATHTTAPSASVCVNCTGPPLEYPYPYPFPHRRMPDLDIFDIAGTMSAWDADDLGKSNGIAAPPSPFSGPTRTQVEHLAATLTVSVALPLRHDPYADGEAAPDVVPFLSRMGAESNAGAGREPPPPPPPTCPKAPRLKPVRVDVDGELPALEGRGEGRESEKGVDAVEVEGLSLDDGDNSSDKKGVVEAAVCVSLTTQHQQHEGRKGEETEGEVRTRVTARGSNDDGEGDAVSGMALRLRHDRRGSAVGSAGVTFGPEKGEEHGGRAGKGAAKTKAKL